MQSKIRDNIFLSISILILVVFILAVSLVTFGIDFNNIIIPTLGITIFLTIYNKTIAGVIKKKECFQDRNIRSKESEILRCKDTVYDNGDLVNFDKGLEYRNKKILLYNLRRKLDIKFDKSKKDKTEALLHKRELISTLIKLLEEKDFHAYDKLENDRETLKIIRINGIKYRKIKRITLFNNVNRNANESHQMEKIGFNENYRATMHTILTLIPSKMFVVFISILTIQSSANFIEALIQILMYTITSIFAFYMGLRNMERLIMVDYQKDLDLRHGIIIECMDNIKCLKKTSD